MIAGSQNLSYFAAPPTERVTSSSESVSNQQNQQMRHNHRHGGRGTAPPSRQARATVIPAPDMGGQASLLSESLIGLLNHACKVVRPGRSFLRRMLDLLHSTHHTPDGSNFIRVMHLLMCLVFVEAHWGCYVSSQYINTSLNHLADDLSRDNLPSFLSKVPWASKLPSPISGRL